MRLLLVLLLAIAIRTPAQNTDWIAPEGKILNYRTLSWEDFQTKEDKAFAEKLAEQNMQALAYVCPAIYFYADSGQINDKGRVTFKFTTKCAFQTRSFVRESTKQQHSNYVLIHEQDHYDIALTYSRKLQETLSSRDYDKEKYNEEINKIATDLIDKHRKTQETYDHDVNPEGRDDKEQQYLWDMRIKKCMDNNTLDFFTSPLNVVQSVKLPGQTVKKLAGETDVQFVVRTRPLYMEFPQEMTKWVKATTEWTQTPAILACYTQKYYVDEDGGVPDIKYRTMAYMFIPNGRETYRRSIIDTFNYEGLPVKITNVFFANADSDATKELVIVATAAQKSPGATGTMYMNRVYDDVGKLWPARLKKLEVPTAKIPGGLEGLVNGKPSQALFKTEKEITEALKKGM